MSRAVGGGDVCVQGTNDDAQISKRSCVDCGYFADDFIHQFVKKVKRRSPLINRGYYSRYAILRQLLNNFMEATKNHPNAQVLSLGAGFDTSCFMFMAQNKSNCRWIEVDFPQVTRRKLAFIQQSQELRGVIERACGTATQATQRNGGESGKEEGEQMAQESNIRFEPEQARLISPAYSILPADLRQLDNLKAQLDDIGFDYSAPTYVLSECVLVYLDPNHGAEIVKWLGTTLQQAVIVIYEQIRPDDMFGQQMVANLELRGIPLRGLAATPNLEAHIQRLKNGGWADAWSKDMDTIYKSHIDPEDKSRIEKLEIFDEFEEWHLIQEHYSVTVGLNDPQNIFKGFNCKQY